MCPTPHPTSAIVNDVPVAALRSCQDRHLPCTSWLVVDESERGCYESCSLPTAPLAPSPPPVAPALTAGPPALISSIPPLSPQPSPASRPPSRSPSPPPSPPTSTPTSAPTPPPRRPLEVLRREQAAGLQREKIDVNITVDAVAGTSVFGQSNTFLNSTPYANLRTLIVADATTTNDWDHIRSVGRRRAPPRAHRRKKWVPVILRKPRVNAIDLIEHYASHPTTAPGPKIAPG